MTQWRIRTVLPRRSLLGLFWVSFAYLMEDTNSPVAQVSFESLLGLFFCEVLEWWRRRAKREAERLEGLIGWC